MESIFKEKATFNYTGHGWEGKNYNQDLSMKEIAKLIRQRLKKEIPSCKFSVRFENFSGGSGIDVCLMESRKIRIKRKIEEIPQEAIEGLGTYFTREIIAERQKENYHQLNHFLDDWDEFSWNNGVFLTQEGHNLLKKAVAIVNSYNFNDSDGMLDYFHTNFYLHLELGRWDKPFIDKEG